jgi:hypothetical protein
MDPGSYVGFQISTKNTNLVEDHPVNISGKFNPDPKIKGYLLQNLCAGSVNNEKDENVAICHLFCSLLKWI